MCSVIYFILFSFCVSILCVSSDELPTFLWNIKGNSLNVKQASALSKDDKLFADSLADIYKDDANILVFLVKKLSLEDFSTPEKPVVTNNTLQNLQNFFETQPFMLLSSVQDPLASIHQSHCGVQEIVVDHGIDDNVLKSISSAFARSCVVILHVADSGILGVKEPTSEELRKVFLPVFDRSSKNIVGIFSGMKSSWGSSNTENRIFRRNLLATNDSANFIIFDNCIIAYIEKAILFANNKTINFTQVPTTDGSSCGASNAVLYLNFKAPEEFKTVALVFNFTSKTGSWTAKTTFKTTGGSSNYDEELDSKDLTAPMKYSFSCGSYIVKSKKLKTPKFVLDGFQVQPFAVKENKFSESFDCVTWFTIPIWMGIFVALLFIIIINFGVYGLFSVHTMDRFDDPKGKSITVAAATD